MANWSAFKSGGTIVAPVDLEVNISNMSFIFKLAHLMEKIFKGLKRLLGMKPR